MTIVIKGSIVLTTFKIRPEEHLLHRVSFILQIALRAFASLPPTDPTGLGKPTAVKLHPYCSDIPSCSVLLSILCVVYCNCKTASTSLTKLCCLSRWLPAVILVSSYTKKPQFPLRKLTCLVWASRKMGLIQRRNCNGVEYSGCEATQ